MGTLENVLESVVNMCIQLAKKNVLCFVGVCDATSQREEEIKRFILEHVAVCCV